MDFKNRADRLTSILTDLSKNHKLSTPNLSKKFNTTNKIIQTDFKEYILPLFDDIIYYDYSSKAYRAKYNFLTKSFLCADELAVIAILKNKSRDKYSDTGLSQKVDMLFENYEDALSHSIYSLSDVEKIDRFRDEIIQIHHAINSRKIIECTYRNKQRELYPLQIKNFDGYWYLICFDTNYKDIRKYHLNSISHIVEFETVYKFDTNIIEKFDNAINAYFKPEITPIRIELFLDKDVSKYFERKPISKTQRIIKKYEDNSCDIELNITDFMEIIPTIQRFLPHIGVIEPEELRETIKRNLQTYIKNFD